MLLVVWIGELWSRGWQPAEVRRRVRIVCNARVATLCELAIHADHAARPGQAIDPRWAAQIAALGGRTRSTRGPWLTEWRQREALTRAEAYEAVVALAQVADRAASLDVLVPPPGAPPSVVVVGAPARDSAQHPMLERVRKLLAKAEATGFEAEAEALTEKAQELMTRYAIDEALLHGTEANDSPRISRVPIDPPYAEAKSVLLGIVAASNRCRAVHLVDYHMSSVLGHADDLAVVEMLFTSLLIQVQTAIAAAGRVAAGHRVRSAAFRSSFLLAYADRVGERLASVSAATLGEHEGGAALPALRARDAEVEDFLQERYGDSLESGPVRGGHDVLGRMYGRRAADEARLDSGPITRSERTTS